MGEDQCDTRDVGRALHRSQPSREPQGLEQVELRTRCSRQRAVEFHTTHKVVARRFDRGDVGHRDGNALFDEQVVRRLGRDGLLVPRRDPCEGIRPRLRQPTEIDLASTTCGRSDLRAGAEVSEGRWVGDCAFDVGRV